MSVKDLLKKVVGSEEEPKKKAGKTVPKKKPTEKAERTEQGQPTPRLRLVNKPAALRIGLQMIISEKAVRQQEHNQVAFQVTADATKGQIAQAVEEVYQAKPLKIRTMKLGAKRRRRGAAVGWTAVKKKAIVTVADLKNFNTAP